MHNKFFCPYARRKPFNRGVFAVFCAGALRHTPCRKSIKYLMKLLEQILGELGADTLKSFTVVPDFGGYFRSVKSVNEFSESRIVLVQKRRTVTVEGENLEVGSYFEEDVFIKGRIKEVKIDG